MATIIGKDLNAYHNQLTDKVELQQKLIEELVKLNQAQEEEIKRIAGEYDILYGQYLNCAELLKHYDPQNFGYPKIESYDKDIMKKKIMSRNIEGVEFIDFSKPKADE